MQRTMDNGNSHEGYYRKREKKAYGREVIVYETITNKGKEVGTIENE